MPSFSTATTKTPTTPTLPTPLHTLQLYLFLGMIFMWFYVRVVYIQTSFMTGYHKARKGGAKKKEVAAEVDKKGSASGSGAASRKKAK